MARVHPLWHAQKMGKRCNRGNVYGASQETGIETGEVN